MDFKRKPGSRDKKPFKGTRRNAEEVMSGEKSHTIEARNIELAHGSSSWFWNEKVQQKERVDPRTGLVRGVRYSVNKKERWETVERLKAEKGDVLVHDSARETDNRSDRCELNQILGEVIASQRAEAKEEEQLVMTRKGPVVKHNVKKKKKKKQVVLLFPFQCLLIFDADHMGHGIRPPGGVCGGAYPHCQGGAAQQSPFSGRLGIQLLLFRVERPAVSSQYEARSGERRPGLEITVSTLKILLKFNVFNNCSEVRSHLLFG
jgi:hypothetical protein